MNEPGRDRITALHDLPQALEPRRDLWSGIEARITATQNEAVAGAAAANSATAQTASGGWRRSSRGMRFLAAAAVVATLAIGVWIGRSALPGGNPVPHSNPASTAHIQPDMTHSPYMLDARYSRDHAALVKNLEAQLATLPPETRSKVVNDLSIIRDSMRDLQAALGRDPSNALLQELLVNSYQDEMRVLTAVQEAGGTGKGI
ncbi:MAG: hypothetical protein JOZ12_10295 [Sinobacteraceae bacterium]|nr:hypothetical protein [Nevskiaceae bacterium]